MQEIMFFSTDYLKLEASRIGTKHIKYSSTTIHIFRRSWWISFLFCTSHSIHSAFGPLGLSRPFSIIHAKRIRSSFLHDVPASQGGSLLSLDAHAGHRAPQAAKVLLSISFPQMSDFHFVNIKSNAWTEAGGWPSAEHAEESQGHKDAATQGKCFLSFFLSFFHFKDISKDLWVHSTNAIVSSIAVDIKGVKGIFMHW